MNTASAVAKFSAKYIGAELSGLPSTDEPIALKAKWKHRKRYQRLHNQVQALESAIKPKRFRKPLDTRLFAYHLPS